MKYLAICAGIQAANATFSCVWCTVFILGFYIWEGIKNFGGDDYYVDWTGHQAQSTKGITNFTCLGMQYAHLQTFHASLAS